MKKIISLSLLLVTASVCNLSAVRADDAPVSAPNIVAPAQPAGVQNTNATVNGATATNGAIATTTAVAPQTAPSLMGMALPFIVMLGIMYFLMIRPQQKKLKEHQTLVSSLKTGDEVVTTSGIIGTIAGINEKVVTLEVSKNVQFKILRSQVNQVVKGQIQDIQANA